MLKETMLKKKIYNILYMSDLSVFDNPISENGIKFYVFPIGYPLFKAKSGTTPTAFRNGVPSFFGIKNMAPEYIESYEEEYGIIFEYITTKPYKLIAFDDETTQERIRSEAPRHIQKIIDENYGYKTKYRDSVGEKDRQLANYLCENGYEGYATKPMPTDSGGIFHIELLICHSVDGIQFVRRITDKRKISYIMEKAQLKKHGKEMEEQRKLNKKKARRQVEDEDEDYGSPIKRPVTNHLFGFDSPPRNAFDSNAFDSPPRKGSLFGGKKKKKRTKNRKNKKKKKTQRIKQR